MQISSLLFMVAPAAVFMCIIGLMLIPLIGYLQTRFSRQLIRQQFLFDEALIKQEIEIREQGCQRISLELHDRVGHMLSLAGLHLNTGPPSSNDEVSVLISAALEAIRSISRGLNTDMLSCLGLVKSLELELEELRKTGEFQTRLEQYGEAYFLDDQVEIFLYRIMQECVSNIIRHAHANRITIILDYQSECFYMTIFDNGCGFYSDSEKKKNAGCGLANIRKRCRVINAELNISSDLGTGTKLIIKIPVHDKTTAGLKA